MKKLKLILVCCGVFLYSFAVGQLKQDEKLIKGKLQNGLTYYIYPNDNPKGKVVYRLFIKSGSLYEREDQKGLAHYLEHLAFNGSNDFPGGSLIPFLQSKGAGFGSDINAHTSMNETVYKLYLPSTPKSFVDSSLMVLSNWAGGLTLDSAAIEKERGIIMAEWVTRTSPMSELNTKFLNELLNESHYTKRQTIGDTAVIKNFTHDKLHDYYNNWYNPRLMAVAVVGDIDPVYVEEVIKKRFSDIRAPKIKVPYHKIENYKTPKFKSVTGESVSKIDFSVIQLIDLPPAVTDEKSYYEYLKRSIISGLCKERFSSLLFEAPAYKSASLSNTSLLNAKGFLIGSAELKPGELMKGMREYAYELERIYRYGFISLEIDKVKKAYINALKRKSTSKKSPMSTVFIDELYSEFYRGNAIVTPEVEYELALKYIDKIDSVSIVKELNKIRKPQQTHYFLMSNDKVAKEIPAEREVLSLFDSLRSAKIDPFTKFVDIPESLLEDEPVAGKIVSNEYIKQIDAHRLVLSNGARVIFKQSNIDRDKISVGGFRQGGIAALDSTEYVNAQVAGSVIPLSGAGKFSREALRHYLAGSSASARFIIERNRSGIVAGSQTEEMDQLFQLLYLKWCFPKMDTTILNQTVKLTIEKFNSELKTETDKYNADANLLINGDSYMTRQLTESTFKSKLDPQRLVEVYNRNFGSAKDFEFVLYGDCTLEELTPYIEKYLAALPSGEVNTKYIYEGPQIPKRDTSLIRKVGDSPKATVSMYFQTNKPIAELRRLNLVGDISKNIIRTKLLDVLREQMNKIYSVSVSAGATTKPGELSRASISFSCAPEDVDTLIEATIDQLKLMVADKNSFESEFSDTKLNVTQKWNVDRQLSLYWLSGLRETIYKGDPDWNYVSDLDKAIESVTADEVIDYINNYILNVPMIKLILLPKEKE